MLNKHSPFECLNLVASSSIEVQFIDIAQEVCKILRLKTENLYP